MISHPVYAYGIQGVFEPPVPAVSQEDFDYVSVIAYYKKELLCPLVHCNLVFTGGMQLPEKKGVMLLILCCLFLMFAHNFHDFTLTKYCVEE